MISDHFSKNALLTDCSTYFFSPKMAVFKAFWDLHVQIWIKISSKNPKTICSCESQNNFGKIILDHFLTNMCAPARVQRTTPWCQWGTEG